MAVLSAVESLLGADSEAKTSVVKGLLTGEGEWQGVPCEYLSDVTNADIKDVCIVQTHGYTR